MVGSGVSSPPTSRGTESHHATSRLDILRAQVRSRQQQIAESIFKSRERSNGSKGGDESSDGELSATLPLHMQQHNQLSSIPSDTKSLQDKLDLIELDRERLRSELASLQEEYHYTELNLQSRIVSMELKCDVLQKDIQMANDRNNPVSSTSRHVRRVSSPTNGNYFSWSENDPSAANTAREKVSRRVYGIQQKQRDLASVEELQNQVENLKAREQSYQKDIFDLQAEVIRLNLQVDLQADEDDTIAKLRSQDDTIAKLRSQVSSLKQELEAEVERAKQQKEELATLTLESTEMRIRISNDTTGRFHDLTLFKSHDLTLYDAVYNNGDVRSHRIRTWPFKIAEDVRNGICKIVCLLLDQDDNTVRIFEIDEMKRVSTHELFDSFPRAQNVVQFTLQCQKVEKVHADAPVDGGKPEDTTSPVGMRVQVINGQSNVSKKLFLPITEDLTVFDKIYNHSGVKFSVRKWPLEIVWQVNHKRSRIVCDIAGVGTREIDALKKLTLKALYELVPSSHSVILLTLKCEALDHRTLPLPFKPIGFRQRGWLPAKTEPTDMRVRLTNETTSRSKDLLVPISDTLTMYDAVYDSNDVRRAHVRKWKSAYSEAVKLKLSAVSCTQIDELSNTLRAFSIEDLKEVTTKQLADQTSRAEPIKLVLRCEITEKGKAKAQQEDIQLRVVNHTTLRFKDLLVPFSEELSLYDAIYNDDELRAAQVRMWPKWILEAIKAETATIRCHLFGEQQSNEVHIFSVDELKESPTKRIFELLQRPRGFPKLVLQCEQVEKGELSLSLSNEITGRFKDIIVPISQELTLYDIIYMNASIKYSYIRMWPSEIVQAVKNKVGEIYCAMMGKKTDITFSIDDLKKTTTSQIVELSPAPQDPIKFVLRYRETGSIVQEEVVEKKDMKEIRLKVTNDATGRSKELTVPVSTEISMYQAIYSHRSVKAGRVRVWPSEIVTALKQKAVEVECTLFDSDGSGIYTFSIEGLRKSSTKRLMDLLPNPEGLINLVISCEAIARTGSFGSKLQEKFKPTGFRHSGWLPTDPLPSYFRVRIANELSGRSKDLLIPISEGSTLYEGIYKHPKVKMSNVRKWPSAIAREVRKSLAQIQCMQLNSEGAILQVFSVESMRETPTTGLLKGLSIPNERVNLLLRCLRVSTGDGMAETTCSCSDIVTRLSSDSYEDEDIEKVEEQPEMMTDVSYKPTGFRQRGWLPEKVFARDFRLRLTNEKTGRWKDLLVPISENLTLYDAVYSHKAVLAANIRKYPSTIAANVKKKVCEIYTEIFIPRFEMIGGNSMDDILFDDEGNAVRLLSIDDLYQTTTMEMFEMLSKPKNCIKMVLKVKKVEAVDALEDKLSSLEEKLRKSEEEAKRGSELLVEKLKALDESNEWNQELAKEVERLKDEMSCTRPPTPRNEMTLEESKELKVLKEKEKALEKAKKMNQSLKLQLHQLQAEIEVLESSATQSIMPELKPMLDYAIQEEDEDFSEDVSFKPIGFRQRGWLSDESSSLDMRLRITNETTQRFKDIVVEVSQHKTVFDALYLDRQSSGTNEMIGRTSKVQCVIWHDLGKEVCTFTVDDLKELSTARFFELLSRRQDLLKVLLRCQEKAHKQVHYLETQITEIQQRNEQLQNSMCVLSNELASSFMKHNRLQTKLDNMRQTNEGGLLFSSELFEV